MTEAQRHWAMMPASLVPHYAAAAAKLGVVLEFQPPSSPDRGIELASYLSATVTPAQLCEAACLGMEPPPDPGIL